MTVIDLPIEAPVVAAGVTSRSLSEEIGERVLRRRAPWWWWVGFGIALAHLGPDDLQAGRRRHPECAGGWPRNARAGASGRHASAPGSAGRGSAERVGMAEAA